MQGAKVTVWRLFPGQFRFGGNRPGMEWDAVLPVFMSFQLMSRFGINNEVSVVDDTLIMIGPTL